jgi:hypothetical protein
MMSKKKTKIDPFKKILNQFKTSVWLDMTTDENFVTKPKTMAKKFKKVYGFNPTPSVYHPITVHWSMKGTGFGEFTFYLVDGKLHCQNEMMSRDFIKVMLCLLVDKAILDDSEKEIKNFGKKK